MKSIKPNTELAKPVTETTQHADNEGIIFYDEKYAPFNRFINSNDLRIFVLDGISEGIISKITHTFESLWEPTAHTRWKLFYD